jgi:pimeloyl-ACP methyl ester carboxylesterase
MVIPALNNKQQKILYTSLAAAAWLVFSERGLRLTMPDKKAKRIFEKSGVRLNTETVSIDNHDMHYVWTGKSTLPTILFIHGSPKSWTYFKDFLKDDQLLERFRLVSIDRPGFGQSEFGKAEHINVQALRIAKLIDLISNGQPVYVVGHSMGATVSVALATLRPTQIKSIVLAGGCLDPAEEQGAGWRKIFMVPPFKQLVPGALRPTNAEMMYLKKDLQQIQAKYSQVNCPVYLIHAKDDKIVPFRQTKYAGKHFTNAEKVKLISFEKGGHFLPTRRFTQFRDILLSALQPELAVL